MNIRENLRIILALFRKQPFRAVILLGSAIPVVLMYSTIARHRLGEQNDLLTRVVQAFSSPTPITLFAKSGTEAEFSTYAAFAENVHTVAEASHFTVTVAEAAGSIANAQLTASSHDAFGLIEKSDDHTETSAKGRRFDVVTELHEEHLQILYRRTLDLRKYSSRDAISKSCEGVGNHKDADLFELPEWMPLSTNKAVDGKARCAREIFAAALDAGRIAAGPEGSTGRVWLAFLADYYSLVSSWTTKIGEPPFKQMILGLTSPDPAPDFPDLDLIVIMSGPIAALKNAGGIGMMAIVAPDAMQLAGRANRSAVPVGHMLRTGGSKIPTLGTTAVLVKSPDVKAREAAIMLHFVLGTDYFKSLSELEKIRVRAAADRWDNEAREERWPLWQTLSTFMTTTIFGSIVVAGTLLATISYFVRGGLFERMMMIYNRVVEVLSIITASGSGGKAEDPIHRAQAVSTGIVTAVKDLRLVAQEIRQSFANGRLTEEHHRDLIENLHTIRNWFREMLEQHLTWLIHVSPPRTSQERADLVRQFVEWNADGALQPEGLLRLLAAIDSSPGPPGEGHGGQEGRG